MKAVDIPVQFTLAFAQNAAGGFTRQVPTASQIGIQSGAASMNDGFPPVCFLPVGAGGTPPFGQDFNGLYNQITAWIRWQGVSGPVKYDAAQAAAIGGYPRGAYIQSATTLGQWWLSLVDDNLTNPDASGANWLGVSAVDFYAVDAGTPNHLSVTFTPAPANLAALVGKLLRVKVANSSTIGAPDITINGFAAVPIAQPDGTTIPIGGLATSEVALLCYDGTKAQLLTPLQSARSKITVLTGSGTFTPSAGCRQVRVRMVGGGGGAGAMDDGGGAITPSTDGATTSFGSVTANGGPRGLNGSFKNPGAGGAASGNGTGTATLRIQGAAASTGQGLWNQNFGVTSLPGAPSFFGGGGPSAGGGVGGTFTQNGKPGIAPGSGGSSGVFGANNGASGGGGAAGEYVELVVDPPIAATFAYAVGPGGNGALHNTGGFTCGSGAAGTIIVEEIY